METQFDITYTVSTISQLANNPTSKHVAVVKQIFWYLQKYPNSEIMFS